MYSTLLLSDRKNIEKFYHYIYDESNIYLERKKKIFDDMIIIKDTNRKGKTNIKKYKLTDSFGNIFFTERGLSSFCKENDLKYSCMNNVLRGLTNNHKGWKIEFV